MCWEGSTYLGAALARSRASSVASLQAPQQNGIDATAPAFESETPRQRRRTHESRWAVDASARTPRSSDDTNASVAEWRAARAALLQQKSPAKAIDEHRVATDSSDCVKCSEQICAHGCACCCVERSTSQQTAAAQRCSCVSCDRFRPFTRRRGMTANIGQSCTLRGTSVVAEYPPHPDDISITATAIWFVDKVLDALRGATRSV